MFSSKKSTVFFLSLIGFFSIAKAQNLSLEIDSANFYFQKKNFALSAEWFEKAKISAKQPQLDTIKYADINRQLAACYYFLKNYEQANIAFKEAISTYEKLPSKRNQLASTLLNYAVFYFNQRKYAEALPIFIRAAELKKGISGESNADYLTILHSLAQCQVNLKQYIEAETNLKKVVALRGQLLGGNHADYLASLTSLAELNKTMLNYEKSLEQFLELAESVKDLKGENSKEYAGVTMKVANLYELLLNYNKALKLPLVSDIRESIYKQSLCIYNQNLFLKKFQGR
jgi:tetratricopeptide (TPR) repeat protein